MKSLYLFLVFMSMSFSVYAQSINKNNTYLYFNSIVFGQIKEHKPGFLESNTNQPSTIFSLNGYNNTIPLAWDTVVSTDLDGYNIYRSSTKNGSYSKIAKGVKDPYYRDESVSNGMTYYYKITAVYQTGESDFSHDVSGTARENGYSIRSTFTDVSPALDGIISAGEWPQAEAVDLLYPGLTGKVTLYLQNNQDTLFLAVDDHENIILELYDTIGLFFDEDRNREWSAESGDEGLVQVYWDNNSNSAKNRFYAYHGKWPAELTAETPIAVPGITQNISINSGHVQTEIAIDLKNSPLESAPDSTIGLLIYAYDGGSGNFTGLWPQETVIKLDDLTEGYGWSHAPFSYGDLKIAAKSQQHFWADVDGDGDVDITDVQLVAAHWNTFVYDLNYDTRYDVNSDGVIDIFDIQMVAYWWNKPLPPISVTKITALLPTSNPVSLSLIHVRSNDTKMVQVIVENADNLAGFQFDLLTPAPSGKIQAIQLGDFLSSNGNSVIILCPQNSEADSKSTIGAYSFGNHSGVSGSGVLVNISYTGDLENITLLNAAFVDQRGAKIPVKVKNNRLVQTSFSNNLPTRFLLEQNYPNPFNSQTQIIYHLADKRFVELKVYNTQGQEIKTLIMAERNTGMHSVYWDGKDMLGQNVSSGVYIYQLKAGQFSLSKKMILLK